MNSTAPPPQFDSYMASVTAELDNIQLQTADRKNIYRKCLRAFKQHLSQETQQIQSSQLIAENKTQLIRNSFKQIYNNVNQGSDLMLRNIRKTFEAKKYFWQNTISDFVDSPDLELKREFFMAKRQAYDTYLGAIDERKNKPKPYDRLISLGQKDRVLAQYQESNRQLQGNVAAGTMLRLTKPDWPQRTTYFDDKENTISWNWGLKEPEVVVNARPKQTGEEYPQVIIDKFMRH